MNKNIRKIFSNLMLIILIPFLTSQNLNAGKNNGKLKKTVVAWVCTKDGSKYLKDQRRLMKHFKNERSRDKQAGRFLICDSKPATIMVLLLLLSGSGIGIHSYINRAPMPVLDSCSSKTSELSTCRAELDNSRLDLEKCKSTLSGYELDCSDRLKKCKDALDIYDKNIRGKR
jgi:hypothetical protein